MRGRNAPIARQEGSSDLFMTLKQHEGELDWSTGRERKVPELCSCTFLCMYSAERHLFPPHADYRETSVPVFKAVLSWGK